VCIDLLKRMPTLARLSSPTLAALAAGARRVRLPSGRWLVRPGRTLSHHYYLVRGRVRIVSGDSSAVVSAGSQRARDPIYPGAVGVETLAASEFLRLSLEALGEPPVEPASLGVPEVRVDDCAWQVRFLTSPLLQRLDPADWQRILRAMTLRRHEPGEQVIAAGSDADCCYVLCAGRAEVRAAGGRSLASLGPGTLFGEDALISGSRRNASVFMCSAGATGTLPAERFEALLLNAVARPQRHICGRRLISLDPSPPAGAIAIRLADIRTTARSLATDQRFAIVGGTARERALAAFLLAQLGLDAEPAA
jgi:CRP-like cAMP-binding protein